MSLATAVRESLERSIGLYEDFAEIIGEEALGERLPNLPSNTVGLQLWCVIGARESFARGIVADEWGGFTCSLENPNDKHCVVSALEISAKKIREATQPIEDFSANQNRLVLDLLEHETSHHGQLIRYLYALGLPIAQSWKKKYALSDPRPS